MSERSRCLAFIHSSSHSFFKLCSNTIILATSLTNRIIFSRRQFIFAEKSYCFMQKHSSPRFAYIWGSSRSCAVNWALVFTSNKNSQLRNICDISNSHQPQLNVTQSFSVSLSRFCLSPVDSYSS
jgi:hypothetical protein